MHDFAPLHVNVTSVVPTRNNDYISSYDSQSRLLILKLTITVSEGLSGTDEVAMIVWSVGKLYDSKSDYSK